MCSALQQSKPKLSWDADDSQRSQMMKRDLSKAEVKEMEYAAYLASDSDDENSDDGVDEYEFAGERPAKARSDKLSELLRPMRAAAGAEGDGTMEMSFAAEAEGTGKTAKGRKGRRGAAAEEDEEEDEELPATVFEIEEAKRKAKRKAKKAAARGEAAGADEADVEDEWSTARPGGVGGGSGGKAAKLKKRGKGAAASGEGDEFGGMYSDDDVPDDLASDPFFAEAMAERAEEEEEARHQAGTRGARDKGGADGSSSDGATRKQGQADDGSKKAKKGKKGKKGKHAVALTAEEQAEEGRREAELELLMLGDGPEEGAAERRGYSTKALELAKGKSTVGGRKMGGKRRREEAAREAAAAAATDDADAFNLDVADSRFSSIYHSYDFAIDPTHPKFRRTAGSEQLLSEIQKRHAADDNDRSGQGPSASGQRPGGRAPDLGAAAQAGGGGGEAGGGTPASADAAGDSGDGSNGLWRLVSKVKARAAKPLGGKAKAKK